VCYLLSNIAVMEDTTIVKLISHGYTIQEIADKENINRRTLEARLIRIRDKSGSVNLAHLVANYFRKGLIK